MLGLQSVSSSDFNKVAKLDISSKGWLFFRQTLFASH